MKKIALLLIIPFMAFLMAACGDETSGESEEKEEGKLTIHTTVYPLQFFTEQIGGDTVDVQTILPPGSDAHTYEPTTKEMVEMAESDMFIYNGAGLEGYAEKISKSIEPEGVTILEAAEGLDLKEHIHDHEEAHEDEEHAQEGEEHAHKEEDANEDEEASQGDSHAGHGHGEQDPHVWLDPIRSAQLAENIKDQLIELNPAQKELYEENFIELEKKLMELDQRFHEKVENQEKTKVIVSHAAYGYWEEAYGIEQIAVSGLSPTNEPSQKGLENIIKVAKEHNLEYVIFEQNITPKVSEVIQSEIGAEALRFHNLSVLTEKDIENEEDYFSIMEQNLDVLTEALSE